MYHVASTTAQEDTKRCAKVMKVQRGVMSCLENGGMGV